MTEPDGTGAKRELDWLLAFDFGAPARSAAGVWVHLAAWAAAFVWLVVVLMNGTALLRSEKRQTPLGGDTYEGFHWGIPLEKRKAVFAELAAAEIAERERAISAKTWGGHQWSREDDRGHQEMTLARTLATKHGISLSQVYLILDEGIRERWPGPDGRPLSATTPPQDPRSTW